jgi:hypothetical protein
MIKKYDSRQKTPMTWERWSKTCDGSSGTNLTKLKSRAQDVCATTAPPSTYHNKDEGCKANVGHMWVGLCVRVPPLVQGKRHEASNNVHVARVKLKVGGRRTGVVTGGEDALGDERYGNGTKNAIVSRQANGLVRMSGLSQLAFELQGDEEKQWGTRMKKGKIPTELHLYLGLRLDVELGTPIYDKEE